MKHTMRIQSYPDFVADVDLEQLILNQPVSKIKKLFQIAFENYRENEKAIWEFKEKIDAIRKDWIKTPKRDYPRISAEWSLQQICVINKKDLDRLDKVLSIWNQIEERFSDL